MYLDQSHSLPIWKFESLSEFNGLRHYVSGRAGGVSKNIFASLNLSYNVNDDPSAVSENRGIVSKRMGSEKVIFPSQTHSSNVQVVRTGEEEIADKDALVTNVPGFCISVMSADCVPLLIYDPVQKAVGAVHSGWRGTVAKIAQVTIETMQREFGSRGEDLLVGIGPSISQQNYEVGPEVIEEIEKVFGFDTPIVSKKDNGKGNIDLWLANKILLTQYGVRRENIEVAEICTYTNDHNFFSARKSGNKTGRFAAGIMML